MSNSKDFTGKVVIITGSSSGIGASAAEAFAKYGAQVVITGRNAKNLSEVVEKCLKVSPKVLKPLEVVADITNEEDCKQIIDSTIDSFGKLDILVNNAGAAINTLISDPDVLKSFDDMIRLNLRSVVQLTHLSVKHLEKTKGNIINVSSMGSHKPFTNLPLYRVAKCCLDFFSKCAALELGPKGIRVNTVDPGGVLTNFVSAMGADQSTSDHIFQQMAKLYPLGRNGTPEEVAGYILFLASDECSWVTGINFICDGGLLNAPRPNTQLPDNVSE